MERSVEDFCEDDTHGKFVQVSGLQVTFDLGRPSNERVVKLLAAEWDDSTGTKTVVYKPVELGRNYSLVTNTYLLGGGNGYKMFKNETLYNDNAEQSDLEIMIDYMKTKSPVKPQIEQRIRFIQSEDQLCSGATRIFSFTLFTIVVFVASMTYWSECKKKI